MYKTLKFYDKNGITRYQSAFIPVCENAFTYLLNLAKHFYGIVRDARVLTAKEQAEYMEG